MGGLRSSKSSETGPLYCFRGLEQKAVGWKTGADLSHWTYQKFKIRHDAQVVKDMMLRKFTMRYNLQKVVKTTCYYSDTIKGLGINIVERAESITILLSIKRCAMRLSMKSKSAMQKEHIQVTLNGKDM